MQIFPDSIQALKGSSGPDHQEAAEASTSSWPVGRTRAGGASAGPTRQGLPAHRAAVRSGLSSLHTFLSWKCCRIWKWDLSVANSALSSLARARVCVCVRVCVIYACMYIYIFPVKLS